MNSSIYNEFVNYHFSIVCKYTKMKSSDFAIGIALYQIQDFRSQKYGFTTDLLQVINKGAYIRTLGIGKAVKMAGNCISFHK